MCYCWTKLSRFNWPILVPFTGKGARAWNVGRPGFLETSLTYRPGGQTAGLCVLSLAVHTDRLFDLWVFVPSPGSAGSSGCVSLLSQEAFRQMARWAQMRSGHRGAVRDAVASRFHVVSASLTQRRRTGVTRPPFPRGLLLEVAAGGRLAGCSCMSEIEPWRWAGMLAGKLRASLHGGLWTSCSSVFIGAHLGNSGPQIWVLQNLVQFLSQVVQCSTKTCGKFPALCRICFAAGWD